MTSTTNPVHKSLTSLLPGLNPVPPRLLAATESLISLSRQRARNLKPDEEIARSHACAELASKKLRVALRLPNIKSGSGAPCRPIVYKRLLTFLENTLADVDVVGTPGGQRKTVKTPTRTPTSGKRKRDAEADADADDGEVDTPSKRVRKPQAQTPMVGSNTQKKHNNTFLGRIGKSASKRSTESEAPEYVLPAVRKMCRAFRTPAMVPHVYTGVCVILALAGRWPRSDHDRDSDAGEWEERLREDVLSATVAIYLLTLTRMQEGLMTTDLYHALLGRSIEILELQEREQLVTEAIEEWIAQIQDNAWTTETGRGADWWDSVPENVLQPLQLDQDEETEGGKDDDAEDNGSPTPRAQRTDKNQMVGWEARREDLRRQLEKEDPEDVLLPGLGTMMNDAVDYFSEEKVAEYEHWKTGILKRMAAIEKGWSQKGKGKAVAVQ